MSTASPQHLPVTSVAAVESPGSTAAIGVICPNSMDLGHILSLFAARDLGYAVLIVPAGPYLDIERNKVVDMFLERKHLEWLICMDSDIKFDPADIAKLTVDPDNHPVVTGIYHNTFSTTGRATLTYRWNPETMLHENLGCREVGCCPDMPLHPGLPDDHPFRVNPPLERDEHGMIRVDAFGAGYLAIHRRVLEAMRDRYSLPTADGGTTTAQAYFVEQTLSNGIWYGEDLLFAMRCVNDLGIQLYAHPEVTGVHFKKVGL